MNSVLLLFSPFSELVFSGSLMQTLAEIENSQMNDLNFIYFLFIQVFLQASGKVSKKKSMNKLKPKPKKTSGAGASTSALKNNEPGNTNETTSRPGTASSVGRKIDEIFQVSHKSTSKINFDLRFCKPALKQKAIWVMIDSTGILVTSV